MNIFYYKKDIDSPDQLMYINRLIGVDCFDMDLELFFLQIIFALLGML